MKEFKRYIAVLSIATIILTSTITSAANTAINGTTATAAAIGAIGDTITVTNTGEFPDGDEIASATITLLNGDAATTTTLTVGGDNTVADTSFLTVATADLTNNQAYVIAFTTVSGDFGTAQLNIGTPTNDRLTVTASVQPVLKFGMEATSKAFGTLTTSYAGPTATGLEVGTNAVNGVTITAESTNGGLVSATASHTIADSNNETLFDAEGYQFSSTLGANDGVTTGVTIAGLAADDVDNSTMGTTNVKTVYTSDKPQNYDAGNYDVNFNVQAKISESTPAASDYTDVIIFTATANF